MNHLHTDGLASCQTVPLPSSCFLGWRMWDVRCETLRYQSANTSQPPLHKTASFVWWNVPASLGLICQVLIITNLMLTQPVNHLLLSSSSRKIMISIFRKICFQKHLNFNEGSNVRWKYVFFPVTMILQSTVYMMMMRLFFNITITPETQQKWISVSDRWQPSPAWDCSEIILYSYFVVLSWNLTPNWRKFDIKFFRTDSYSIKDTAEW